MSPAVSLLSNGVAALGIRGCVWERVIVVAGMTITQS